MNTCNKQFTLSSFLAITLSVLLSGCGGTGTTKDSGVADADTNNSHPAFLRSRVTESPRYSPSGVIDNLEPTFIWKAILAGC